LKIKENKKMKSGGKEEISPRFEKIVKMLVIKKGECRSNNILNISLRN